MSSMYPSALTFLDDSLAIAYEGLRKLEAAESVDVAEMIRQVRAAAASAHRVRALVSSELPNASWQNREELDALIENYHDQSSLSDKWYQAVLRLVRR